VLRALAAACAALLAGASALAQPAAGDASAKPTKPRAAGGELLAPAERAVHVVVGRVGAPRQLDPQGYSALLAVEEVLRGNARPGMRLRIAWEELAPSRAVRFADGERVLVALDSLPNGSLWTARFPKRNAVAVAGRGEAFAREIAPESLPPLRAFLALPPGARDGAAGAAALVRLVAAARTRELPLAQEAVARLGGIPALAAKLSADDAASLAALIADSASHPSARAAVVALAGRRKLVALAPAIRDAAAAGGTLAPAAVEALGAMGALSPEEVRRYAASRDSAVRTAVLRGAPSAHDPVRLAAIARGDDAGSVRAAALEALARREGVGAAEAAADALFDADADVQAAALRILPAFPRESAQLLRTRAFGPRANDAEATKPALAGLSLLGSDGAAVLREIEQEHPNEQIRRLAQFLLGRTPEH
jgi:hypothetical protein